MVPFYKITQVLMLLGLGPGAVLVAQPVQPAWSVGGEVSIAGTWSRPAMPHMPSKIGLGTSAKVWLEGEVRNFVIQPQLSLRRLSAISSSHQLTVPMIPIPPGGYGNDYKITMTMATAGLAVGFLPQIRPRRKLGFTVGYDHQFLLKAEDNIRAVTLNDKGFPPLEERIQGYGVVHVSFLHRIEMSDRWSFQTRLHHGRAVRSFRKPDVYPNAITKRNRLNETGLSFALVAKI